MNTVEVIKSGNRYSCTFDDLMFQTSDIKEVESEFNHKFDLEYTFDEIMDLANSLNNPSPLNALFTSAVKPKGVIQPVIPEPTEVKPEITLTPVENKIEDNIMNTPETVIPEPTLKPTENKTEDKSAGAELQPIKIKPKFTLTFDGDRYHCSFNKKESKPREESGVATAFYKATGRNYDFDQIVGICDGTIEYPDREHTTDPSIKFDNLTGYYYVRFNGKENKRALTQGGVVTLFNKTYKRKFDFEQIEQYVAGELKFENKGIESGTATIYTEKKELVERTAKTKFDINKRFEFLERTVSMVANKLQSSVILSGQAGAGKSHTVISTLESNGYVNVTESSLTTMDDIEELAELEGEFEDNKVDPSRGFIQIKGYSTAKGLYRMLHTWNGYTLILDDIDNIYKDSNAVNLLKAALDTGADKRIISWNSEMRDEDLPRRFEFTGSIIFITNKSLAELDSAVRSRSICIDLSMTRPELIKRMTHIAELPTFMPEFPLEYKMDAIQLIDDHKHGVKDLSLRDLIQITRIRASDTPDWKEMAEYVLTSV